MTKENTVEELARAICFERERTGDTAAIEQMRVDAEWDRFIPEAEACLPIIERICTQAVEAERALLKLATSSLAEARETLMHHFTAWDGEPEDGWELRVAVAKCDQALSVLADHLSGDGGVWSAPSGTLNRSPGIPINIIREITHELRVRHPELPKKSARP